MKPVALVTGARRGIGRACALALAHAGWDVAATDLVLDDAADEARAAVEAAGARCLFLRHDVAAVETHAALLAEIEAALGPVSVLVNNAGRGAVARGDLLDLTPENFDAVMSVNLRGTAFLAQAAARAMLAREAAGPRTIVTITSVSAALVSADRAEYCVSKAALSMFSQALCVRLAPEGIGVFEVRPGIIATDMTAPVAERYEALIRDGLVPARRWGTPEDVAAAIVALCDGRLGFSTGSVIQADGGLSIGRL